MVQLIHLSDTHLGAKPYHMDRLSDHVIEAFDRALEYVGEARPQLLVIAGDVLDQPRPETRVISHLVQRLKEVAGLGVKVVLAHGEHDTPGRRDKTFLEVVSEALSGVYAPRAQDATLEERVSNSILRFDGVTVGVYHFVKAHIERQREYVKRIMPLYKRALGEAGGRKVFVAHIGVEGALIHEATHINPRDLPDAHYAALGHHHNRWIWRNDGGTGPRMAVYPGSLYQLSLIEARSQEKRGPILVDLSGEEPVIQEEYVVEVAKHIVTQRLIFTAPRYEDIGRRIGEVVESSLKGVRGESILHVPIDVGRSVSRARIESIVGKLSRQYNTIVIPHVKLLGLIAPPAGEAGLGAEPLSVEAAAAIDPVEIIKSAYKVSEETARLIVMLKDALASGDEGEAAHIIDELTAKGELLRLARQYGLR